MPPLGEAGVDRTSLREQCRELIRDAIVDGSLPPGERLVETKLSQQLQVSRGTLREALRHLEQEGLVVSERGGRMRVRTLTPRDVLEVYDVRTALEVAAAVRIAESTARDEHVADLRARLEPLKRTDGPLSETIEHDLDFHHRLCELSDNQTLLDTWNHLLSRIRATVVAAGPTVAPALTTWERHEVILDAIADGDENAIRDLLTAHMREAATRIADAVRQAADRAAA
jgi:DNA-binding GntR family transcriptional regulator